MIYLFSVSSQRGSNSWVGDTGLDGMQFSNIFTDTELLKSLRPAAAVEHGSQESFYALNERVVAAESCWFAAKVGMAEYCISYF